jgi:hypothetical protein
MFCTCILVPSLIKATHEVCLDCRKPFRGITNTQKKGKSKVAYTGFVALKSKQPSETKECVRKKRKAMGMIRPIHEDDNVDLSMMEDDLLTWSSNLTRAEKKRDLR